MATKRYALKYRRRREGKTDYKKRLQILRSREPRIVVRKSNANITVQVVKYEPDGDKVLASASTKQLEKLGWKHATSNIPASYLAGVLAGVAAKKAKVSTAVVDLGMQKAHKGGRLFAAVKGILDAGVTVPVSEDVLPPVERLSGAHMDASVAKSVETIKKKAGAE